MPKKPELFLSIDIETDGPVAGLNSMLALGVAAFTGDGEQYGTWYSTLTPLPDAYQDTDTMNWWTTQPDAWAEVCTDQQDPAIAIPQFARWVGLLKEEYKLVPVALPASFDFPFVNYYGHRFAQRSVLGFSCCDIRSYANGLAGYSSYQGLPKSRFQELAGKIDTSDLRPHVALDDAIEQGRLFMALRSWASRKYGEA
jgi:hypothetical protein